MPNWDEDSSRSRANFEKILEVIHRAAERRDPPAVETAKYWHQIIMSGLTVPEPRLIGSFRGEPGLEYVQVRIGSHVGVAARLVAGELRDFEERIQILVSSLDAALQLDHEPDKDQVAAILDVCAWAHSEWVRIHPFANGNGRTARVWANSVAVRYGLPPFVRFRPRPRSGYTQAGLEAMRGDWKPTSKLFRKLLDDFLNQ